MEFSHLLTKNDKNLIYDAWLSKMLQVNVYEVLMSRELVQKNSNGWGDLLGQLSSHPLFLYSRIPTDDLTAIESLEKFNFNLIDTNVIYDKPIWVPPSLTGCYHLRFVNPEDRTQVVELARQLFVYSRFHQDPYIRKETANHIKAEWANNYFKGERGDQMIIASDNQSIVGFLQLILEQDKTIKIDLVGVAEQYRGMGIASDMIRYAEKQNQNFLRIITGTQIANIASIRLYEKMGFRAVASKYIFHYHSP